MTTNALLYDLVEALAKNTKESASVVAQDNVGPLGIEISPKRNFKGNLPTDEEIAGASLEEFRDFIEQAEASIGGRRKQLEENSLGLSRAQKKGHRERIG